MQNTLGNVFDNSFTDDDCCTEKARINSNKAAVKCEWEYCELISWPPFVLAVKWWISDAVLNVVSQIGVP